MRKDHIERMQDPAKQEEYISKDSVERWALNDARSFPHGPDVQRAWDDLRSEVRGAHTAQLTERSLDAAISTHINEHITPFKDFQAVGRDLGATAQNISFGIDFTSQEVAQMIASDVAPDGAFIDALRTTANDPDRCRRIHTNAKQLDATDLEMAEAVQAQRLARLSFPSPASDAVRKPVGPQATTLQPRASSNPPQQRRGIER